MRAHWTDKALLRLQQVHDYVAKDSPLNAQRFVDRLTRKAALIAHQPRWRRRQEVSARMTSAKPTKGCTGSSTASTWTASTC